MPKSNKRVPFIVISPDIEHLHWLGIYNFTVFLCNDGKGEFFSKCFSKSKKVQSVASKIWEFGRGGGNFRYFIVFEASWILPTFNSYTLTISGTWFCCSKKNNFEFIFVFFKQLISNWLLVEIFFFSLFCDANLKIIWNVFSFFKGTCRDNCWNFMKAISENFDFVILQQTSTTKDVTFSLPN